MSSEQALAQVKQRILAAARAAGRNPADIRLLAVGKTKPAEQLEQLARAGQYDFGENYVQEALDKMARLSDHPELVWHFIGPLQSNKTRAVAEHFHWVHSVDRLKIVRRLNEQRPSDMAPLNVCLQVNISGEAQKAGVSPDGITALARETATMPRLRLRGLMCLPAPSEDPATQRRPFRALRELADRLRQEGIELDTLSMGMSADLEAAIQEGSTLVRVGSALFGPRK